MEPVLEFQEAKRHLPVVAKQGAAANTATTAMKMSARILREVAMCRHEMTMW